MKRRLLLLAPFLLLLFSFPSTLALLRVGFYSSTCPKAELVVRSVVQTRFRVDRSIAGSLLRMHFHDCFVRGCDASILIAPTKSRNPPERAAFPNLTVRGFGVIHRAKAMLETICPRTVSCADIVALATRDAVLLTGGFAYAVPTGRRDGLISSSAEVILPGPNLPIPQAIQAFAAKGLNVDDMVTLLGGHSIGLAHCNFFRQRLFNFNGTGSPDPAIDRMLRAKLSKTCGPAPNPRAVGVPQMEPRAYLDQNTSFLLDNQYYKEIMKHHGVMLVDQQLAVDRQTAAIVARYASNPALFRRRFAEAMVKLGTTQVLVGNAGEIRRRCDGFNTVGKPRRQRR